MNGQLTLDVLIRKGLVSEADFQNMTNEIADKRKLKNILTKEELEEVAATLRNFRPKQYLHKIACRMAHRPTSYGHDHVCRLTIDANCF